MRATGWAVIRETVSEWLERRNHGRLSLERLPVVGDARRRPSARPEARRSERPARSRAGASAPRPYSVRRSPKLIARTAVASPALSQRPFVRFQRPSRPRTRRSATTPRRTTRGAM